MDFSTIPYGILQFTDNNFIKAFKYACNSLPNV